MFAPKYSHIAGDLPFRIAICTIVFEIDRRGGAIVLTHRMHRRRIAYVGKIRRIAFIGERLQSTVAPDSTMSVTHLTPLHSEA